MSETSSSADNSVKLQPYLSPLAVWALSVGSAIGWSILGLIYFNGRVAE